MQGTSVPSLGVSMLNIRSILVFIYEGIKRKDQRFKIEDDEHILDTKTGVELHLYDNTGKITHGEDIVAEMAYFTPEEQHVLLEIKKLITDPEKVKQKIAHYPVMVSEARARFAGLFENPEPVNIMNPIAESNTTNYSG